MKKLLLVFLSIAMCLTSEAQTKRLSGIVSNSNDPEDPDTLIAKATFDSQGRMATIAFFENKTKTGMTIDYENKTIAESGYYTNTWTYTTNSKGYITSMTNEHNDSYLFTYTDDEYVNRIIYTSTSEVDTCSYTWKDGNITRVSGTGSDVYTMDLTYNDVENKANISLTPAPGDLAYPNYALLFSAKMFGINPQNLPITSHAIYQNDGENNTEDATATYSYDSDGFPTFASSSIGSLLTFTYTDVTSGIKNVTNNPVDDNYYNIMGQRVNKSSKGLMIHNGKKFYTKE